MPAILAKKLGMTQRFLEDGRVERVTVLEAGPCPVTAIRTVERDGYEAVQLAFDKCKEKSLTRAELGHLKKADASAHRVVREFRDEAGELLVGETVTVDVFAPGDEVKVSGKSASARAFKARSSATTSRAAHVARLPQHLRARLDRRLGHAVAGVQGRAGPGRMGGGPRDPAGPDRGRSVDPESQPPAAAGISPGTPRRPGGGAG